MQTRYEHLAVTSMLGAADAPPRTNGGFCFSQPWERQAFALALALARDGHIEWEDFRRGMIEEIASWEATHDLTDPDWSYYERWLAVLERIVVEHGLAVDKDYDASSRPTEAKA
jgi:nitrile hydratase accessory protein